MSLNYHKLGDVLTIERGGSPRPIQKYLTDDIDGLNWIKISDATASDKYIYKTKQKISKDGLYKTRFVNEGDFILSNSMSFGKPYIMKTTGCIHDGWLVLRNIEKANLERDFLYYILCSPNIFEQFNSLASGSTVRNLNIRLVSSVKIPIPPIEEQKQIVEILDKAFKSIEKAKTNIEKNIQNSKELFQSRLTEIFSQKNDDWEEKKLEELANDKKAIVSGPFGSNLKVADYRDSGVPIIRLQNVGKGYFIEKDIKYIDKEKAEELKSHSFVVGDIVLAKLGIPIGKTCIIPETFNDGIILADIVRIRPDKKRVNYKFLEYFLNTDLSVSQLTKNISGATRPRVNLSNVRNIVVPIPSFETQNKLVFEIDKLSEQTKQLENQYKQKLNNLEELKKSILQKAFSGELIP
ncbi:restriction endonuclease subunit S [Arcobacter sp.]|uniref:restriction endonuclease subunit S n=1 Tax=Arcobacter sp. TaxID=1872629 RepID=UPI003C78FD42